MKPTAALATLALLSILALSTHSQPTVPPATKLAIFDMQAALTGTHEGQAAYAKFEEKYDGLRQRVEKKQADVQALQERLRKSGATMNDDARSWLEHEIDSGTRAGNHDAEDLQAEANLEQGNLLRGLRTKMLAEIGKYAAENGYTAVLDIGAPQNQVLWNAPATNITQEVVSRYEKSHPAPNGN